MITKLKDFNYKEGVIGGDEVYLVTPNDMGVKWTNENRHLRSCIIRKSDGKIISIGQRKFTNLGEQPDFEPWQSYYSFEAFRKMDGSLLIISRHNGELIVRTRGTFSIKTLENGQELDFLIKKYPKLFNIVDSIYNDHSVLLEWTTPSNVIVLKESDEPTLTLLNIINHKSLEYKSQIEVDEYAAKWNTDRPTRYYYNSLQECIDDVTTWKGAEGVVLYHGQYLKKIKAAEYLRLHRCKSAISSMSNLIELFVESGSADEHDFYKYIELTLDHELAEIAKPDICRIGRALKLYTEQYREVEEFIKTLVGTRKEQALAIISQWFDWRKSLAFILLDNKTDDQKKAKILEELVDK